MPLVPRARRLGVRERMRFDGTVATALDERSLGRHRRPREGRRGRDRRVLPARLPQPEAREGDGPGAGQALPGAYVSLSSEVLPQIKENERVWTTVVNAYVGPGLSPATCTPRAEAERRRLRG